MDEENNTLEEKINMDLDEEVMDLDSLRKYIPDDAKPFKMTYEGPDIVIYTKNKKFFVDGSLRLRPLSKAIKKRIHVRPDASISVPPEKAKEIILSLAPEEAEIKEVLFEPEFSKAIIFAKRPGLIVGKEGELIRKMKESVLWDIELRRVPLIPSSVVSKAREIIHEEREYRKKFLEKIGEKIQLKKGGKSVGWARISALGSFGEVGRSAILLQTKSSRILLDFGAGMTSSSRFPYLDIPEFSLEELDAVIVSHAHIDHCGLVPLLYELGYRGPVYMTEPTRDLATLLQLDFIEVAKNTGEVAPYTSKGIKEALKHTITLSYGEVFDITPDARLTFFNAGHILGSASVHIHLGQGFHNFVYTGDIKFGPSKLLQPAFVDYSRVESMLIESTYGGREDVLPSRKEADENLIDIILSTAEKKGKVLIPVFAVGRSQEVMMTIAEYKRKNPDFNIPVYLDGMIYDVTAIHTTYPEYMSPYIQKLMLKEEYNPFGEDIFIPIKSAGDRRNVIDDNEPAVILSTSGMMNGGPILEYFRELASDERNTLVFIGYQAQGTLGSKVQKGISEVSLPGSNQPIEVKMNVVTVEGFSGHSDRRQLLAYLNNLKSKPKHLIINHGEPKKSHDLADAASKFLKMHVSVPRNLESVRLK